MMGSSSFPLRVLDLLFFAASGGRDSRGSCVTAQRLESVRAVTRAVMHARGYARTEICSASGTNNLWASSCLISKYCLPTGSSVCASNPCTHVRTRLECCLPPAYWTTTPRAGGHETRASARTRCVKPCFQKNTIDCEAQKLAKLRLLIPVASLPSATSTKLLGNLQPAAQTRASQPATTVESIALTDNIFTFRPSLKRGESGAEKANGGKVVKAEMRGTTLTRYT